MKMQTILGAGGPIGIELAKALTKFTTDIRLVSRNPEMVNSSDTLLAADILDKEQLTKAVKGSSVVYVTVGFPYDHKKWQEYWPIFIKDLIVLAKDEGFKIVFFDNVYMYDKDHLNPMTENTPVAPSSKKGKVRAEIARMILNAAEAGEIRAVIARCADYYGPDARGNSILYETVIKPLSEGKKANWFGGAGYKHSFTYTPDAGKATAILGNSDTADGQVWHLPTVAEPPTGKEWVELIAGSMNIEPKFRVVPGWMLKFVGWFSPLMRELSEMNYQYDRHYVFDSSKFNDAFGFTPTTYREGVSSIVGRDEKVNES